MASSHWTLVAISSRLLVSSWLHWQPVVYLPVEQVVSILQSLFVLTNSMEIPNNLACRILGPIRNEKRSCRHLAELFEC